MALTPDDLLRRELSASCHRLHARGWVANHDGNISHRLPDGRVLASPTAISKAEVAPDMLVIVDGEGKVVEGSRRVFSEIGLHLACYRARPDVRWVFHAHPPKATAFAVAGHPLFDPPFMAEPVVSLGARVPLLPPAAPGSPELLEDLARALAEADAVLLGGHGVLTVGADAETALLRMEFIEHLAAIHLASLPLGGPRPLPADQVETLLAARQRAGLGPQPRSEAAPMAPASEPDIQAMVRAALQRFS